MIFSQIEYFYFFSLVFLLHWTLPKRARIWLLLVSSLAFYGTWNWRYLGLMLASCSVDYFAALKIHRARTDRHRNIWLLMSLIANLGTLAVFKYFNFFMDSAVMLLSAIGISSERPVLSLLLPVGISFYTFQSMSYTIDIWRRDKEPEESLVFFTTFVAFFPQLVAGPIVRAHELIYQLRASPDFNANQFKRGAKLFLWGLVKKNLFADIVALQSVDVVFKDPGAFDVPSLALAAVGYSLQIYADFSGYSDMARGSSLMLGYDLVENFRTPYRSRSITEFWRRWHISLSTWLRDYLYISLGGNRHGRAKTDRNLMLTMLLGGLWHGAGWTFVLWGGLQGLGLMIHRAWLSYTGSSPIWEQRRVSLMYQVLCAFGTFTFVCITFVLFRCRTIGDFFVYMTGLFGFGSGDSHVVPMAVIGLVGLFFVGTAFGSKVNLAKAYEKTPWPFRSVLYAAIVMILLLLTPSSGVPFVYFQF